jgi:hypothetical protein
MILMSLPWTHSEYEQLIGRIIRQGSNFKTVDIIIPKIVVTYNDEDGEEVTWSRDRHKLNVIHFKKDLFGIVVDGIIPDTIVTDLQSIKRKSLESLNHIIERIKLGELIVDRDELEKEFLEHSDIDEYRRRVSDFGELNRLWNTRNSSTNYIEISRDMGVWNEYHKRYREVRKNWSREETPFCVIADKINKLNKPHLTVADFGCGDNLLKTEIPNKVMSFDMGKNDTDDSVIICDMSHLPIEDETIHIGVFSISLMGRNYKEHLSEARRVLVTGGRLFIAEPNTRWENRENGIDELKSELESEGFDIIGNIITTEKFFYIDAVKGL